MKDPNENRKGYKQTKVGWIPGEWKCSRLGDLCKLVNGRGFKPHEWDSTGLPIIRIQNLNGSKEFNYFSGEFHQKLLVEKGQLLYAWSGSRGASFGPHIWQGPRGLLNYHTWKVEIGKGVHKVFLLHGLRHITSRIENDAHGASALVHVQKSWMEDYMLPHPTMDEQRKIAEILTACDLQLEKLRSLIEVKMHQRDVLMRHLLSGKKRLPGFKGKWDEKSLLHLLKESRVIGSLGGSARKLTVKLYGLGILAKVEKQAGSDSTQYYKRSSGQFIYSKLDFLNGAFGIVPDHLDGFESTLDLPAFDISSEVCPDWLLSYVSQKAFYKGHLRLANGGRKARRINPKDFKHIMLLVPEKKEQEAIAEVDSCAASEIAALRRKLDTLTQQRKFLLQKLLTGEVRVKI